MSVKQDDVTGRDSHWRFADDCAPTRAARQDVVLHHMLRTRHHGCGNFSCRRSLGDPAAIAANKVVDRSSQANVAQYVGQDVVAHI